MVSSWPLGSSEHITLDHFTSSLEALMASQMSSSTDSLDKFVRYLSFKLLLATEM